MIHVRLDPMAANYGESSRSLSHGGVLSVPFHGATRLLSVQHAATLLPPGCVRLMLLNVPGHLGSTALPRAVLEAAGYTVEEPGAGAGPLAPRQGVVVLCQMRPGALKGGGHHSGIIIAEVLPPLGDPWLRDLPPALVAEGLEGHRVQTLIAGDPLSRGPPLHAHAPPRAPDAVAHAGGSGHLMTAAGAAFAGAQSPLAAPLPPPAGGALPRAVDAAEPSGSPSQGQPPGQGLGSVAGGLGGVAPTHRAPGVQNAPSFAPGGSAAPTPGGSPSPPPVVPSGSFGRGFGVEAGGAHGGAPPPRAPGVRDLALLAPGGPAAMPSGSSTPAALPQSTSSPAPSGMAPPPPPSLAGPAACPICQEAMDGSTTTTSCGHQFCTQCFVNTAATSTPGLTFPCPLCRRPVGSPIPALRLGRSSEQLEWERQQEQLELAQVIEQSLEEAPALPPPPLSLPSSSFSPSLEAPDFSMPLAPGVSLVPSSAPGVSALFLAPPRPQPAPASSGTGAAHALSAAVAAMDTASAPSAPWRRRSERERPEAQPLWRSNPAAHISNDGSRSSSVEPSRSGRHRSRSTSPPARPPPAPFSAAPAMLGTGSELRPRSIEWGSGVARPFTRRVAWGSGIPQLSSHPPLPPARSEGGQGRW
jgi:hypothetical protein